MQRITKMMQFVRPIAKIVIIGLVVFIVHEVGHIIAQLIFGIPVVLSFSLKGISTNMGLPINFAGYAITLAGIIAPFVLLPIIKKNSVPYPKYIHYVFFILFVIAVANHDFYSILTSFQ